MLLNKIFFIYFFFFGGGGVSLQRSPAFKLHFGEPAFLSPAAAWEAIRCDATDRAVTKPPMHVPTTPRPGYGAPFLNWALYIKS